MFVYLGADAHSGHAAYGSAVNLKHNKTRIGATYFMTYHSVLKTSQDFTGALRYARELSDNITAMFQHNNASSLVPVCSRVFPYRSEQITCLLPLLCFCVLQFDLICHRKLCNM